MARVRWLKLWPIASIMAVAGMSVSVGLGGSVLAAASGSGSPARTGTSAGPNDVVYYTIYRAASDTYQGAYSGDWRHCVYATASQYFYTIACNQTVTVTASFSASGGYTSGIVSATVGFDVEYSSSFGNSASFNVDPGQYGWLDAGFRYDQYLVGMESETCIRETGQCFGWSAPTYLTVQHVLGDTYQAFFS